MSLIGKEEAQILFRREQQLRVREVDEGQGNAGSRGKAGSRAEVGFLSAPHKMVTFDCKRLMLRGRQPINGSRVASIKHTRSRYTAFESQFPHLTLPSSLRARATMLWKLPTFAVLTVAVTAALHGFAIAAPGPKNFEPRTDTRVEPRAGTNEYVGYLFLHFYDNYKSPGE